MLTSGIDKEKAQSVLREAVLELNASDDRGIDVVRNSIKSFAQKKVTLPPGKHKIIILDEADSMTKSLYFSSIFLCCFQFETNINLFS
jgi:DNA polymerase III delta prime subunit